jgi:son of sevenless-like protein
LDKGEPQICDFGISRIMEEPNENTASKTVSSAAVVRYAAPEVIEMNNVFATTQSDTYSFAMLILECITEEVPFSNITRDAAVIHARISKKQVPSRPDGQEGKNRVTDLLWDLMKRCWSVKPEERPTMETVHNFFLNYKSQRNDT